jgi:methyltransferase (TIGR00027 family)
VTRTLLFDRFILDQVEKGVDTVLNLAAGLDARPYRLPLPPSLRWIEVDLPAVLDYKERVLTAELPGCALERVRLDLADVEARRARFAEIGAAAGKVLIISEGLLIYLTGEEVASLAQDLSAPAAFSRWVLDLASPGLLKMLQKQIGSQLSDAGAPLKFAPEEGPAFFAPRGWRSTDVRSMLRAASEAKRTPLWLSLLARLPEPPPGQAGSRPWSGVCLLEKADAT